MRAHRLMRNARQERRLGLRRERARRYAWLREAILWPETTLLFGDGFWVRCVLRWWMPGLAIAGRAQLRSVLALTARKVK